MLNECSANVNSNKEPAATTGKLGRSSKNQRNLLNNSGAAWISSKNNRLVAGLMVIFSADSRLVKISLG